ncbi:MAG: hypothetical protein WAM96_09665 [Candidatus Acidiferrales bacterium]
MRNFSNTGRSLDPDSPQEPSLSVQFRQLVNFILTLGAVTQHIGVVATAKPDFGNSRWDNCHYLNVPAGTARSTAASDDSRVAYLRINWPRPDPLVPMVRNTRSDVRARKAPHSGAQPEG